MRRACDPPTINSRSSTESSHIMIVKAFVVITHGPMMIRKVFSRVDRLRSTVRGELGLNINVFM